MEQDPGALYRSCQVQRAPVKVVSHGSAPAACVRGWQSCPGADASRWGCDVSGAAVPHLRCASRGSARPSHEGGRGGRVLPGEPGGQRRLGASCFTACF